MRIPLLKTIVLFIFFMMEIGNFMWGIEGGAAWTKNGVLISSVFWGVSQYPVLTSDGNGGAIVTWLVIASDGYLDIYAQKIDHDGNSLWPANGIAVCTAPDNQNNVHIINDGFGGAIAVWEDSRSGTASNIYAQRISVNGDSLWTPNGVGVCTVESNSQREIDIAADGSGGVFIAWENTVAKVFVQHLRSNGTPVWSTNGIAVCPSNTTQTCPKVIKDFSGGIILIWGDDVDDLIHNQDIRAQRIDANGNLLWSSEGSAICIAPGHQLESCLISDGFGGAFVVWRDERSGIDEDIYAQRVDANGNPLWIQNGIPICIETGDQACPQLISDCSNGSIIVWFDQREFNNDLFCQRIDENGNRVWNQNGIRVCSYDSSKFSQKCVSDNAGGAIITWEDYRSIDGPDIYIQKINKSGNAIWASNGVVVCDAYYYQTDPQIVSDNDQGALIVWKDFRSQDEDEAYIQKIGDLFQINFLATGNGSLSGIPYQKIFRGKSTMAVTAIADVGYSFLNWTGSGGFVSTENPLVVQNVQMDMEITANFQRRIYPPLNFQGVKRENRSLAMVEYLIDLSWEANPANQDIVKYRIYLVDGHKLLDEVDSQTFFYRHRNVLQNQAYAYQLVAINNEGREGEPTSLTVN